jgi:hypothetical protein
LEGNDTNIALPRDFSRSGAFRILTGGQDFQERDGGTTKVAMAGVLWGNSQALSSKRFVLLVLTTECKESKNRFASYFLSGRYGLLVGSAGWFF